MAERSVRDLAFAPIALPGAAAPSPARAPEATAVASREDDRPRTSAARSRSAAGTADDRAAISAEIASRHTIAAVPFLPVAAGVVAPPMAPSHHTASDAAPPVGLAGINRERAVSAGAAEGQSNTMPSASERSRDNGSRAAEVAPAAIVPPRPRSAAEPAQGTTAPQPLVFRSDAPGMIFVPGPAAAGRLMELAAEDPTLHAAALGNTAHVRLDTGTDGDLALHMVVKDGVVDLRVDGTAAQALDIRQSEVRTALAGEGISLGRFEAGGASTGQSFGSQGGGFRDGTTDQGQHGSQAAPSSSPRETSFADAAASQTAGGPQSQGNWGGGSRHFAGQDHNEARSADRDAPTLPRPTSANSSSSAETAAPDARPRRGFHVTA